jgi:transposase
MIHASRGQKAARELLGEFDGTLVSDRWSEYNIHEGIRQLCWSHLKRDFEGLSERSGKTGNIGEQLLAKVELMFRWWHWVRDGTFSRGTFQNYMKPLRVDVEELLCEGTVCGQEKMQSSCKRILKQASALWRFVDVEGVEPTNNTAERAVRPGVLWRKGSFGTQSAEGSRFAERIMAVAATCKQQGRNIVEYISEACHASLDGRSVPSLLPKSTKLLAQII